MNRRYFRILCYSITLSTIVFSSCKDEKTKTVKPVVVSFKKEGELTLKKAHNDSVLVRLDIEIADNEFETQTGLMYRESMKEHRGMLFIFPDSRPRSFYMKNTRFPLDIIYLDDQSKVVSFHENAKPLNENSLPSNAAAKFVLEVNAGLVAKWQLEIGDSMTYSKTN